MLVLGLGEEIPEVRRFQNCRKYFAFGEQSGSRVDGHVLFAGFGHFKSDQIGCADVLSVVGSSHMQCTAWSGFPVSLWSVLHFILFSTKIQIFTGHLDRTTFIWLFSWRCCSCACCPWAMPSFRCNRPDTAAHLRSIHSFIIFSLPHCIGYSPGMCDVDLFVQLA